MAGHLVRAPHGWAPGEPLPAARHSWGGGHLGYLQITIYFLLSLDLQPEMWIKGAQECVSLSVSKHLTAQPHLRLTPSPRHPQPSMQACPLSQDFPCSSVGKESACSLQETQVRSLGEEDPLEKGMATHSSILAWRIPWTEGPGGLQSTGSRKSDMT